MKALLDSIRISSLVLGFGAKGLPEPQITYLFKDLYKEIIIRNPSFLGSR